MKSIRLPLMVVAVSSMLAVPALAQTTGGSNPAGKNKRERTDAPQKDPTILTDREQENLLPKSQTLSNGKDANLRADANDSWSEWLADLVERPEGDDDHATSSSDQSGRKDSSHTESGRRGMHQGVQTFITKFDEDSDGELARKELPEGLRQGFKRIDLDGSGTLNAKELRQHAHRQLAQRPVTITYVWVLDTDEGRTKLEDLQEAYAVLSDIDRNSDGKLTRTELQERRQEVAMKWVDQCFEQHDADSDGTLSREEAQGAGMAGRFKSFDDNSDGLVSRKEVKQSLEDQFQKDSERTSTTSAKKSSD